MVTICTIISKNKELWAVAHNPSKVAFILRRSDPQLRSAALSFSFFLWKWVFFEDIGQAQTGRSRSEYTKKTRGLQRKNLLYNVETTLPWNQTSRKQEKPRLGACDTIVKEYSIAPNGTKYNKLHSPAQYEAITFGSYRLFFYTEKRQNAACKIVQV